MAIKIGDRMPQGFFHVMNEDGPGKLQSVELFPGRQVVLFAVPGAFTPGCSKKHLPGFIAQAQKIRDKGIDTIACLSVNDVYVMTAWAEASGAGDTVQMLADGSAEYTRLLGLELDSSRFGMGIRSRRYAMIIEDGVVRELFVDPPGKIELSTADNILANL
jgi:peroxiredoxin